MPSTRAGFRIGASLGAGVIVFVALGASVSPQTPEPAAAPAFDQLEFRAIGPAAMAGRIDDFAVYEANPSIFYVATATGGLWKTTNRGTTFETVFDHESTSSIGAVAVSQHDPSLVWVGTGENNNRQSSSWGDGVYKSTDGGKTWKNMGLAGSRHISTVVIDPLDSDVVYVAALGSLWGPGGDRGVYKTTDGGATWTRVLFVDDDTGVTEIDMDPANNKVLYAATYQRRRAVWGMNGGGPGSGIYKSTDAGQTWTELTNGIPQGLKGRIGLDIYRRNPSVLYARIEHPDGSGVYRSEDGGGSWTRVSSLNPRPMYFSQIRVDPTNEARVYVLGVQLHISDDGGRTFRDQGARRIHVDFHAMWINPRDSNHLMIGGDGGVGISYDKSETYVWLNNMPLGQFYHVHYDMQSPYTVCGGLQDNNSWCGPSAVRSAGGIGNDEWFVIGGGDGFVALADPTDSRILYAESQDGRMNRVDRLTNERKAIRPEPPAKEAPYRWNWDTPMAISPHDPATIFVAANRVLRSTDRGHSWQVISPDLTTATDRETLSLMGVAAKDFTIAKHDGVGAYGTLVTFAESPRRRNLYWAGSDDGLVHVSTTGGEQWADVTEKIPGLPKGTYVSRLAPSRFADGTVYATFDGHRLNDFGTYVYASTDTGQSWRSIRGDLPDGQVARTITEDLKNPDVLYLGTETGLFVTVDRGRQWRRVKANLPTVPIYEITLHPRDNDMILATHGRSIWILDDLTPFQQYGRVLSADAALFDPPPAVQRNTANDRARAWEGDRQFLGANPAPGVTVAYHLKQPAKQVRLAFHDASGTLVREFAGEAMADKGRAGVNLLTWDLRVEPLPSQPGVGGGLNGPLVLPGDYRVSLVVEGREASQTRVSVAPDPEIQISDADRRTHYETLLTLHRLHGTANEAAVAVTALQEQLTRIETTLKRATGVPDTVTSAVEAVSKTVTPLRRRLGVGGGGGGGAAAQNVRGRITGLKSAILGSTSVPTEIQVRMIAESRTALASTVGEVNAAIGAMANLHKMLAERGLFPELPKEIKAVVTESAGR